jgi:hypothetical protein
MPKVDIRPLAELFRTSVLKMLKDEGRLVVIPEIGPHYPSTSLWSAMVP